MRFLRLILLGCSILISLNSSTDVVLAACSDADNLVCQDDSNAPPSESNTFNEYFGENSVCVASSIDDSNFCYQSACNNQTLYIFITDNWFNCESHDQIIEVDLGTDGGSPQELQCPQFNVTCEGRDGESLSSQQSLVPTAAENNETTTITPTPTKRDNIFNFTEDTPFPSASPTGNMTDDDMFNATFPPSSNTTDSQGTPSPTESPGNFTSNNAGIVANRNDISEFSDVLDRLGISPGSAKTVFAPNNDAFEAFSADESNLWNLYQTAAYLLHREELMLWHLVTEDVFTTDEIFNGERTLMETEKGNITIDQQRQRLDGVPRNAIVDPNVESNDGIVHVTSRVIVPPYLQQSIIQQCLEDRDAILAFSTMANLALFVGLDEEINRVYEGGVTFLVPPNRRFIRAEIDVPSLLTEELADYTRDFVLCHMIDGNHYEDAVFALHQEQGIDEMMMKTYLGTTIWITTTEDKLRFQSRDVILPDQLARNGVFHGMDFPLFPPFASDLIELMPISTSHNTEEFFRLFPQTLLTSEDIALAFDSNITVFVPNADAFAKLNNLDFNRLLEPIWVRHAEEFLLNFISIPARTRAELVAEAPGFITMLNGETYELRKNGPDPRLRKSSLEQARSPFGDILALDGYINIMDTVLTPTALDRSVYDQCTDNPEFSLLVENIKLVELDEIIDRDLPLTFLAPDNRAFRRVEFGATDGGDIIRAHLFRGLYFHDEIANATTITSVNGVTHQIEVFGTNNETIYVGGAYIYKKDMLAWNGVLHFIDRIIGVDYDTVPPTVSPAPTITAYPTSLMPPTFAPVSRPSGPTIITFPPQVAIDKDQGREPGSPPSGDGNDDDSSGATAGGKATSLSLLILALFGGRLWQ